MTQLTAARQGEITPECEFVAEREGIPVETIRDEVAAGRMVIPANRVHLSHQLDPMAIGRASLTKVNANMGASPVSSGMDEEVEKLRWAERWAAAIHKTLDSALQAGGSSLRDYVQTNGELGYFQHQFSVYGREGEPCPNCDCEQTVKRIVQSGRSTFYCPRVQR